MVTIDTSTYQDWARQIDRLDREIEAIQEDKKTIFSAIRQLDRQLVPIMKNVMRLRRMTDSQRADAVEIDEKAREIMQLLDNASSVGLSSGAAHQTEIASERSGTAAKAVSLFPTPATSPSFVSPPSEQDIAAVVEQLAIEEVDEAAPAVCSTTKPKSASLPKAANDDDVAELDVGAA